MIRLSTSRMVLFCQQFNASLDNAPVSNHERLRRMAAQELRLARSKCRWGNRAMMAILAGIAAAVSGQFDSSHKPDERLRYCPAGQPYLSLV